MGTIGRQRSEQIELIEMCKSWASLENLDCGERIGCEDVDVSFDSFP